MSAGQAGADYYLMEDGVVFLRRWGRRWVVWITLKGALRLTAAVLAIALVWTLLTYGDERTARTWKTWATPLSGKTIALDAGHGGVDGGAVSKQGVVEKDLNMAIALYLRDYLQQAGAIVVMTREGDYDLAAPDTKTYSRRKTEDLHKRVNVIKGSQPHLVVSIHMNSIPSAKWSGAQTFYNPANHQDSKLLAAAIQNEIKRNLENTSRVAATENSVYLLKAITDVPTALIEVGFLSNPGEAARLADSEYQRKVAASIYQGLLRYAAGEK